ncbi:MAG: BCCT family transporter [Eggerthellaceae bacterium]|nr:BCCT family transporter [Eggerthellaceae bacterium]
MNKNEFKNPVFLISLILCLAMAIWAVALNENFTEVANAVFAFLTVDFAWLYLIVMLAFVIFALCMAFSKWGKIKLGPDNSKPAYSTVSWFAMLFGCGMGVGLVFWGIAEPISHYAGPMAGIEPMSPAAADFAISASFMHWGVHPWANYSIIGLALAYAMYRKGKAALISSALEPVIGEKNAKGALGKVIDILAIFATMAGVVTSLGLGVLQINAGLNYLFGIPTDIMVQITIICVISVIFIGSAVLGIKKGISKISDLNLYIALAIMVVCLIVGPTLAIMNNFVGGMGQYIGTIIQSSLGISAYGDNGWMLGWRVFYWAWWIAWAPFVGVFIARISRGRTVREFVLGVVLVPAIASIIWFSIFGSMGLSLAETGAITPDEVAAVAAAPETGLFMVLTKYPMIILCFTFFITSANSGTFVLGMLSSKGNQEPPNSKKVLWGIVLTIMAIGLLIAGGLKPLQTISIAAAFPFIFIMIAAMVALVKGFAHDADTPNMGDPDFVPDPDVPIDPELEEMLKAEAEETAAAAVAEAAEVAEAS